MVISTAVVCFLTCRSLLSSERVNVKMQDKPYPSAYHAQSCRSQCSRNALCMHTTFCAPWSTVIESYRSASGVRSRTLVPLTLVAQHGTAYTQHSLTHDNSLIASFGTSFQQESFDGPGD